MPAHWTSNKTFRVILAFLLVGIAVRFWMYSERQARELPVTRVEDRAGLLTQEQVARLSRYHDFFLADHDIDYYVLTHRNTGDINSFALSAFTARGVGVASRSGHGLLLVVDPDQDQVRLEVSQSLEGVFVDAFVAYVEQRQMVPFFAAGRVADGILASTELMVTRAQNAARNAGFSNEAWAPFAAGAGATAHADIDTGYTAPVQAGSTPAEADTPGAVLAAYMDAMSKRNADPTLPIYSELTQVMMGGWVVTPAQMDNVVRTYRECGAAAMRKSGDGERAVIRYPVENRQCSPWFFVRENGAWRLDLTMMQQAIRFGRGNQWRFVQPETHDYGFAFTDWRRDRNGFPHAAGDPR